MVFITINMLTHTVKLCTTIRLSELAFNIVGIAPNVCECSEITGAN